jgi:hypothetical protein
VRVSFGLTLPPNGYLEGMQRDLYLLGPAEVAEASAPGGADPAPRAHVEQRGFAVVSEGRLALAVRDRGQARHLDAERSVTRVGAVREGKQSDARTPGQFGQSEVIPDYPSNIPSFTELQWMVWVCPQGMTVTGAGIGHGPDNKGTTRAQSTFSRSAGGSSSTRGRRRDGGLPHSGSLFDNTRGI